MDSSVSLRLKNIFSSRVIACPPVERDGLRGSVSKGRGLQGPSFLTPLQKERIGCIFNLLYLDLFIVDTHCGQGTGHLLLGSGGWVPPRGRQGRQETQGRVG